MSVSSTASTSSLPDVQSPKQLNEGKVKPMSFCFTLKQVVCDHHTISKKTQETLFI